MSKNMSVSMLDGMGSLKMDTEIMSELYDKDVIAYGTGNLGKTIIPYLIHILGEKFRGVTNSRIATDYEGTFFATDLPLRSLKTWYSLFPDATVLITNFSKMREIYSECKNIGFKNIRFTTFEIFDLAKKWNEDIAAYSLSESSLCFVNELHDAHKASFAEFKSCNKGKSVAVVGSGPSLDYYTQIEGVPHIGVNECVFKEDITLDYYFIYHYVPEWCEKLKDYNFIKFFGAKRSRNPRDIIPEYIIEENGGRIFFSDYDMPGTKIQTNIEYYPLMGGHSVIFGALQFALYTHPKKIFLVGCDCSLNGYFSGAGNDNSWAPGMELVLIGGYKELKKFTDIHYPDTEIISVNPVGLKGLFHDVYTESYLEAFPELCIQECEILTNEKWNKRGSRY